MKAMNLITGMQRVLNKNAAGGDFVDIIVIATLQLQSKLSSLIL